MRYCVPLFSSFANAQAVVVKNGQRGRVLVLGTPPSTMYRRTQFLDCQGSQNLAPSATTSWSLLTGDRLQGVRPLVLLQTNSAAKAASSSSSTGIARSRRCLRNILSLDNNLRVHTNLPNFHQIFAMSNIAAACLLNTYSLSWDSSSKIKARGAVFIAARPLCTPNIYRIQVLRVALELMFLQVLMLKNLQPSTSLLHSITPIFLQQTRQQTGAFSTLAAQACSCPLEETSTTT